MFRASRLMMKINIESNNECKALEAIVNLYLTGKKTVYIKSDAKRKKEIDDAFKDVANEIQDAISGFKIGNNADYIGPMKCTKCYNEWVAIFPKTANKLECPKCHEMMAWQL